MEKQVLNLEEAAALLDVSPRALRAAASRGEVPGRLVAGRWRFSRPAIHAWLGHMAVSTDPWADFAGVFSESPFFEEVMSNISAMREQQRRDAAGSSDVEPARAAA